MNRYTMTGNIDRSSRMDEHPAGEWVLYLAAQKRIEELEAALAGQQQVYKDIGAALGVDMPRELVNAVARQRMAELLAAKDVVEAVEKLVKAKGRYHTEQNYKALADALEAYRENN